MKMPQRSQILQALDRFAKKDPELYEELRRKATDPADDESVFPVGRKAAEILEEFEPKLDPELEEAPAPVPPARSRRAGRRADWLSTQTAESATVLGSIEERGRSAASIGSEPVQPVRPSSVRVPRRDRRTRSRRE